MTFQEKSIWVSLVITVLLFGYYFTQAIMVFTNPGIPDEIITGLFIGVVIFVIILQIVMQSVTAIVNRKEAEKGLDERDKLIELKATRVSYFVLVIGVWISCAVILVNPSGIIIANFILFFFIIAELIGYVNQLISYRRGS